MSALRQAWILARSDLRQELREFELVLTSVFFTLVVLALYGVSFVDLTRSAQPKAVPGMLWIAIAFVGTLTLTRVFERERESDTLSALLAAPVRRAAVYWAKFVVTSVVLGMCAAVLVPGLFLLFPAARSPEMSWAAMAAVVALGCVGYTAVGTLFAAGLAQGGAKNVLLSVVLYPLTLPVLMISLVATQRVLQDHPGAWDVISKIAAVDVILVAVGVLMFESVLVGAHAHGGRGRAPRPVATSRTAQTSQIPRDSRSPQAPQTPQPILSTQPTQSNPADRAEQAAPSRTS